MGKTIVTRDGTTLLGADDKAGVAAIMTLAEELLRVRAPPARRGPHRLHARRGGGERDEATSTWGASAPRWPTPSTATATGELNKETFSADGATVTVHGRSIHPGMAKGVMVNALRALADVIVRLPRDLAPETTDGREPFIHPHARRGRGGAGPP